MISRWSRLLRFTQNSKWKLIRRTWFRWRNNLTYHWAPISSTFFPNGIVWMRPPIRPSASRIKILRNPAPSKLVAAAIPAAPAPIITILLSIFLAFNYRFPRSVISTAPEVISPATKQLIFMFLSQWITVGIITQSASHQQLMIRNMFHVSFLSHNCWHLSTHFTDIGYQQVIREFCAF